jgi:hypothetical protein
VYAGSEFGNLREQEALGVNRRIILKCIFKAGDRVLGRTYIIWP